MRPGREAIIAGMLLLTACSVAKRDGDLTIQSLEHRSVAVEREGTVAAGHDKAIAGYREFLDTNAEDALRVEAMRRLGDLEMERNEQRQSGDTGAGNRARPPGDVSTADYRNAIKLYQDMLRAYPKYPGNDRVLYQLSKAYEYTGDLQRSLRTLDRLISTYPNTGYRDEVQFRRGELLFVMKEYRDAEEAYGQVLGRGDDSLFYEKALYKHGWALFKQGRYDAGLDSFFVVLDRKLAGGDTGEPLADMSSLTRGEKELMEDTFRVVSLSLSYTEGANGITRHFTRVGHRDYEYRVYQALGDLYLKQERIKDAADAYNAFVRRNPNHPQSPLFQVRVIEAYRQAGFASLVIDAKKEFVVRYGIDSDYQKLNRGGSYAQVLPHVKANLEDLARHYHASAQKTKSSGDYQEAARWYRVFLKSFPEDSQAPKMNFLLAEMLFEDKRFDEATGEYEKTAYGYPRHTKSADAGYAALLAYAEHDKRLQGDAKSAWQQRTIASSLRFADANPGDARAAAVLTRTAEVLYALRAPDQAAAAAKRVLALTPEPSAALRRTAWTVVAHTEFEKGAFDRAEMAYQQVLALTADNDAKRPALVERLASAVYKRGEQARSVGDLRGAVAHFMRVGQLAPASAVRATAEYDAAAGLIALKDWAAAIAVLDAFRSRYPGHALQADVSAKLAVSYLESGQLPKAAAEFEKLAATKKDPEARRQALWQVTELYEKAGRDKEASAALERYLQAFPAPLEPAVEARHRLADLHEKAGGTRERMHWLNEIVRADQRGGRERTDRTRFLAASAAMALAEPAYADYRRVALVEPLKKSLKIKKDKMQTALESYGQAADYGVAEVATAATYRIAEIYNDFGRALLVSQRPKGLSKDELEQYNVLLEEQAYPFEEKAIELHEVNAQRTAKGIYDQWVKGSLAALGKLSPVRYAKAERSEVVIDAIR